LAAFSASGPEVLQSVTRIELAGRDIALSSGLPHSAKQQVFEIADDD
jgi:hypothetical protein